MSQLLFDDLEEGEIADDIAPEPIVQKPLKPLPRRYVINDKKLKSRHKKRSCKHIVEHHKRKSSKSNIHSHSKPNNRHHKTCPKHNSLKHSKFPTNSNFDLEEFIEVDSDITKSKKSHKKIPKIKSAFKNFRSPPRMVLNIDNSKLFSPQRKAVNSNYSKSPQYKKSPNGLNKLKNISNFNELSISGNEKQLSKGSSEIKEILVSKQKCENLPPVEVIDVTDDEDEEELRRIALATCLKRATTLPEISSEDSSSKITFSESEIPAAIESDNYEIVDMDVDNESENLDKVGDLFIIDTTPTYFNELNGVPPTCLFDPRSNINQLNNGIVNGFLPNINVEDTYQNFNEVLGQNVNNDLYTNFEVDNSRLPSSQLEDEFEEELLRAELIANMKSVRQNNGNLPKEDSVTDKNTNLFDDKITNIVPKDTRIVKFKSDSCNNDRIVNIDKNSSVNDLGFRDERTVSIVKDIVIKDASFVTKSRIVSSNVNSNVPIADNSTVKKGADIKVKLNNIHSVAGSAPNIISLPQERIIISLNNETSSDDSDQDDFQVKLPEKNPAVASIEALISSARQESDGKKNSPNLNGTSHALSCLSKAQQEEYNSLIKILAKKKEPFMQNPQMEVKKVQEDANMILLKKKFAIAKDTFEKEKALMNTTMKELVKKKRSYMLSKIKTQQLKEQLVAAEKVRKANLQTWTKCASELQTLKKSVSKRQALINSLQTKISSSLPEPVSNRLSPMSNITPEQEYLLR